MIPHPDHKNYHGFTCPQCGGHQYHTDKYPDHIAERLGMPKRTGRCDSFECHFFWNRDDKTQESVCIYHMPHEEWEKLYV